MNRKVIAMFFRNKNKRKSVYIINGFEGAGKTDFIKFTLAQPYFKTRGTTMLVVCEDGTEKYDKELLTKTRTVREVLTSLEEFTPGHLEELQRAHAAERIVVEWNGKWDFREMKLPLNWDLEQQITITNAKEFQQHFTNERELLSEMMRNSEMIIFNRCDDMGEELASYRRNIKALNPGADVIFEDKDGEINTIFAEDLPYDLDQDVIELDNAGYGMWYLDCMDNLERYMGKTVKFKAMVLNPKGFDQDHFVPGRMAMTCCANDMAFLGYTCHMANYPGFKDKEWVEVTAKMSHATRPEYKGEDGPYLEAVSVEKTTAPKEPVISFV